MGSLLNSFAISLFPPLLLPWIGFDHPLLLLKARSPLENSVTCLSGHISMEDLQSQTSASMDWLSKFPRSAFTLQTPSRFHLDWTSFFKKNFWLLFPIGLHFQFCAKTFRTEKLLQSKRSSSHIKCGLDTIISSVDQTYYIFWIVHSSISGWDIWLACILSLMCIPATGFLFILAASYWHDITQNA